jgi:hypothetical protein
MFFGLDPHTCRFREAGDELYGLRVANTVQPWHTVQMADVNVAALLAGRGRAASASAAAAAVQALSARNLCSAIVGS